MTNKNHSENLKTEPESDTAQQRSRPDLSVVIVTTASYGTLNRTIQHLATQTVQDRLEIIIIAPSTRILDLDSSTMAAFFGYQVIEVGTSPSVDGSRAVGIRQSRAPIVAFIEDHAFPASNWAEVLIATYQGPWSGVGTAIANANPQSMVSWTTFLLGYGTWADPVESDEVDDLPRHNVSYRRDVLMEYDAVLEEKLELESDFHQDLKAKGHRFYLIASTKIDHLNVSRLSPALKQYLILGRLYGATRAREEQWSLFRRLLYIGGAPLIPLVRLGRVLSEFFGAGQRNDLLPNILPSMFVSLIMDATGQALGYAFDRGHSLQQFQEFEVNRLNHVNRRDRQAFIS